MGENPLIEVEPLANTGVDDTPRKLRPPVEHRTKSFESQGRVGGELLAERVMAVTVGHRVPVSEGGEVEVVERDEAGILKQIFVDIIVVYPVSHLIEHRAIAPHRRD